MNALKADQTTKKDLLIFCFGRNLFSADKADQLNPSFYD